MREADAEKQRAEALAAEQQAARQQLAALRAEVGALKQQRGQRAEQQTAAAEVCICRFCLYGFSSVSDIQQIADLKFEASVNCHIVAVESSIPGLAPGHGM